MTPSTLPQLKPLLVLALLGCVCAGPAFAENLTDIYALSRNNDPKFLAMRSEFEATGFAVKEARAALLPNIGFQYGRTNTSQNILSSDNAVFATGSASYPTNDKTLSITQPIFRLASWRNWKQSESTEKQAAAAYAAAEQDLIVRTATAYMAVLAAGDALAFARSENESIKRQLDLATTKYTSGQAIKANLYDAQARNALKESDVIAAGNDLADKVQALREMTGAVTADLMPLPVAIRMTSPDPLDADAWVVSALEKNLLLEARLQAVEVARQEIAKRKAGYYPTVDLAISRNQRTTGGSLFGGGSSVNTNDVAVRLNIPIYEGGATSAQTGQAVKHLDTALQDLERDRRQVERQTRAAYRGVVSGMVRVRALDKSVIAFESAQHLKEEGYKAGVSTLLGVLDAERDLYAARRDAAQSRYDFQLNALRLKQAAGTLSEVDLEQVGRAAGN
ncbi:Type I secretion outer membrane protein, TolC precursor [Oxalobacteraceae bacterium IMCC9480]|nr:Type I secretion outer membrane protein, TolC precursor [Oxalobacteraceae bacterium IMCC9480]NDP59644.1 TolC family outer membrane protein [Oxalobacteraceae bacterium]